MGCADNTTASRANPTIATAPGMPFGLAFLGTAFSEFDLIKFAFDFEQVRAFTADCGTAR